MRRLNVWFLSNMVVGSHHQPAASSSSFKSDSLLSIAFMLLLWCARFIPAHVSQGWKSKSGCFASCGRSVVCTKPSDAGRQQSVVSNYIYVGCACRRRQKRHIWATNGVNGNTVKVIKGGGLNKTVLATAPKHEIYSRSIFRPFRNQGTSQSKWQSVTIFTKKLEAQCIAGW